MGTSTVFVCATTRSVTTTWGLFKRSPLFVVVAVVPVLFVHLLAHSVNSGACVDIVLLLLLVLSKMADCRTTLLLSLLLLLLLSFLFHHCVVFVADCCVYHSPTHSIAANVVVLRLVPLSCCGSCHDQDPLLLVVVVP